MNQRAYQGQVVTYTDASGVIRPAIVREVRDRAIDLTAFNETGILPLNNVQFDESGKPNSWRPAEQAEQARGVGR